MEDEKTEWIRRRHYEIVIINGSARKGNTLTAINAFIKGADEKNEIEVIAPDKLHISPCKAVVPVNVIKAVWIRTIRIQRLINWWKQI